MMIETSLPVRLQYNIQKKNLQLSLLKSNSKYGKLHGFEKHPGIEYGFGILLNKYDNIVFVIQTPLNPPVTSIDVSLKISIASANFSYSVEEDYVGGYEQFENVICSYRKLFCSSRKYFVDDVLIVRIEGFLRYRHEVRFLRLYYLYKYKLFYDLRKFSCAVCFVEYPYREKILCESVDAAADRHSFCQGCLLNHAATEGAQLIDAGFKCMEYGCKNSIVYSVAIQKILPQNIRKRIDNRIMEENLARCGLNLERCRNCNFAVEMEQSKEQNMVFPCPICEKEWCRFCEREWNDEHQNFTCAELDAKQAAEIKQRELERKLSEAVVRKCECGLQFMKEEACNKMTCLCKRTQCYLCRATNITYDHFCRHEIPPPGMACPCRKKCTLWADANEFDQTVIDGINAVHQSPQEPAVAPQPQLQRPVVQQHQPERPAAPQPPRPIPQQHQLPAIVPQHQRHYQQQAIHPPQPPVPPHQPIRQPAVAQQHPFQRLVAEQQQQPQRRVPLQQQPAVAPQLRRPVLPQQRPPAEPHPQQLQQKVIHPCEIICVLLIIFFFTFVFIKILCKFF